MEAKEGSISVAGTRFCQHLQGCRFFPVDPEKASIGKDPDCTVAVFTDQVHRFDFQGVISYNFV